MTEIPLSTGMLLVFYTDGLVESPGADPDDSITHLAHRLAAAADDRNLGLELIIGTWHAAREARLHRAAHRRHRPARAAPRNAPLTADSAAHARRIAATR